MTSESQTQLTDAIASRQREIYRRSFWCSAWLLFLWIPIIVFTEPGTNIRPMVQGPCSDFLIMPIAAVNAYKGIKQLRTTWPERKGVIALIVSLIPIVLYLTSQWVLLGLLRVTYGG